MNFAFYMFLACFEQKGHIGSFQTLQHETLVTCSPQLLTIVVSLQWQDPVNILLAHHRKTTSVSIDGTIKPWNPTTSIRSVLCNPVLTYSGHRYERSLVGLSVAIGSESNEVFVYHKSIPIPVASYKFNHVDPVNGKEVYVVDG